MRATRFLWLGCVLAAACGSDERSSGTTAPGDDDGGVGGASNDGGTSGAATGGGTASGGAGTGGAGTGGAGTGGAGTGGAGTGGAVGSASLDAEAAGSAIVDALSPALGVPRDVDLLLVIDNSFSMQDKQGLFAPALEAVVSGLTALDTVQSLHLGVITSSLGGFGSTLCAEQDDHGRLSVRGKDGAPVDTYENLGFLNWDPSGSASPPGSSDAAAMVVRAQDLVLGTGEGGCGFESTLEAWYRFLAEPNPPTEITVAPCSSTNTSPCATPTGRDSTLLAQRNAFLRDDSVLVVVILSDENDCSMQNTGQLYYPARQDINLPRASSACAADPNDPCCYSCGVSKPATCPADPSCSTGLAANEDPINLRCFQQKRRFGLDFLYPTDRYVNALTKPTLCPERSDLDVTAGCSAPVPNPIARDRSLVFLAGVIGVPWQAVTESGATGVRFKTGAELTADGRWDVILGDKGLNAPGDPLMIESIDPRSGTSFAGEPLAPPDSPTLANSANGHEWANPDRNDLQYACIFPLATPRDCDDPARMDSACECQGVTAAVATGNYRDQKPQCQDPETGAYSSLQHAAKAYPSQRILQVLRDFGDQGVVTSICPPAR